MEEVKKTFELEPVLDKKTGKCFLKDADTNKALVENYIHENVDNVGDITDDVTFKAVKEKRTDLRKKLDAIKQARISANQLVMDEFNTPLKEIETMLTEADNKLKEKVDAYNKDVKGKVAKPTVIKLVVTSYDAKAIDAVKAFAVKKGCQVEVK